MDVYIATIMPVAFPKPPKGWAQCNGQQMSVQQNQALSSVIGTTYGGDGKPNFNLPDLRGRAVTGLKRNETIGTKTGTETVALAQTQTPRHTHLIKGASASGSGRPTSPEGKIFGTNTYAPPVSAFFVPPDTLPQPATGKINGKNNITPTGGGKPHENMQPFLVVNYIIALAGLFPGRN